MQFFVKTLTGRKVELDTELFKKKKALIGSKLDLLLEENNSYSTGIAWWIILLMYIFMKLFIIIFFIT